VATSWASDLWQPERGMATKWSSSGRRISISLIVGCLPSGNALGVGSLVARPLDGCQVGKWWSSDLWAADLRIAAKWALISGTGMAAKGKSSTWISGSLTVGWLPSGRFLSVGSLAALPWDGCQVVESWASDFRPTDHGMAAKWQRHMHPISGSLTVGWLPSRQVLGVGSLST
jgi:hypothetical protein